MTFALLVGPLLAVLVMGGCQGLLGIPDEVTQRDATASPDASSVDASADTRPTPDASDASAASDGAADTSPVVDAADAAPACDVTREFDTPQLIPSLSTVGHEGDSRFFGDDELTVMFDAIRGDAGTTDIYTSTRPSLGAAFGPPAKIPGTVNTADYEHFGNVTDDGLSLFFERQVAGISKVYRATRATTADPWGSVGTVDINTNNYTAQPFVRGDGSEIWHVSVNGASPTKIYVAKLVPGSGYVQTEVTEVNLVAEGGGAPPKQFAPVVSHNGLTIYFATTKHLLVPSRTDTDIWIATRASTADKFSLPREVPNVNGSQDEEPTWISKDGCRLYLHSNRPGVGQQDLYMATRKK